LFESIDEGFCIIEVLFDAEGKPFDHRILQANPAFERQSGVANPAGKRVSELVPGVEQYWHDLYAQVIHTGESIRTEERSDALNRWFNVLVSRVGAAARRQVAIVFTDISERKQAEATLQQTAAALEQLRRWDAITAAVPDFIYTFALSGRFTYISQALLDLWQKSAAEALGKNFFELDYPEALAARLQQQIQQVIETRQPLKDETPYTSAFGTRAYEYIFVPMFDATGNVEAVAGVTRDITERKQAEATLRESEQRFRLMADAVPQIVWLTDAEGRVEFFNKQWSDYTGVPYEPTTAAAVAASFVHPDDGERTIETFNAARRSGGIFSVEHRIRSATGSYRWFLVRAEPYRDPLTGEIVRWFGASTDIHDRKQAEEALREREQRLTIATEAAQLGIFEWKVLEDVTVWENERQYEMFGLTSADGSVSAQEFFEHYLHPDDAAALTAKLTEAKQTGTLLPTSYRIRRQDGTTRWLEVNGQFEFATDGAPVRFLGANVDITERKQAEAIITTDLANTRLLRDLSTRLLIEDNIQVLYDQIMAAAITLTRADAGTVQILDKATQELVLLAAQGFDCTITDHFDRVNASSNTSCGLALIKGTRAFIDFDRPECDDPCGALRMHVDAGYRSAQSTPLLSRSGQPIGMVSTHWRQHYRPTEQELRFLDLLARQAADLIEQRQTEAARQQVLAREQAARTAAEQANRIKDEFLAVLSHELRSPLNPILGWTRLLRHGKLAPARQSEALATIERNAKLQAQLIEDLLDISRIMQGKLTLTAAPVSLAVVIAAAVETVSLAADAKKLQITLDLDSTVAPVSGDAGRLQQVVWNLLTNAVKFTDPGGQVMVALRQVAAADSLGQVMAQLRVSDTGKGISPSFLPHVFEAFRQADGSTTRQFGGLGLGLAIVRQIVELHGGTVTAASRGEQQGATFSVQLPILPQALPLATSPNQLPAGAATCLDNVQILLVEDDADTREFQAFLLEQYGATVTAVASGIAALQALEQWLPDVLVSDIGMADMDGYRLIQQIRSRPPSQGGLVPAIALTAYAAELDQKRALQAGFQQHLTKPLEPERLVHAIVNLL
jgi:PAS domain S-box-containing protein